MLLLTIVLSACAALEVDEKRRESEAEKIEASEIPKEIQVPPDPDLPFAAKDQLVRASGPPSGPSPPPPPFPPERDSTFVDTLILILGFMTMGIIGI